MATQDPRTKFKTTEYEKQEQEVPGLQSEMTPAPDCGETSYQIVAKRLTKVINAYKAIKC